MNEKTTRFDASEHLDDEESIAIFLSDALETQDTGYIAHAIGIAAKAKGMTAIAKDTGLSREALYRTLGENGNPTLQTLLAVSSSLGVSLSFQAKSKSER